MFAQALGSEKGIPRGFAPVADFHFFLGKFATAAQESEGATDHSAE